MRLLNTKSLELAGPYVPDKVPDYAIFSHRWSDEEVTFADICNVPVPQRESHAKTRKSILKIQGVCKLALEHGYEWIWIDNCCMDKSSSAELQEAINSMWRYYAESNVCYAYFEDILDEEAGRGIASDIWRTQAHETIMTTVTKSRNEMSTVLPLLAYGDVASTLTHFDKFISKSDVTHVAVLNHTTTQHPKDTLCLLLRSQPDSDEFLRLQLLPTILHELGDLRH